MKRMNEEFDVLLFSIDPIAGDLARDLLSGVNIPSMLNGPDFDRAELGLATHNVIRHPDLLVPKGSREKARAVLVEAWGEAKVAENEQPRAH
jgi:hypothetical protein